MQKKTLLNNSELKRNNSYLDELICVNNMKS